MTRYPYSPRRLWIKRAIDCKVGLIFIFVLFAQLLASSIFAAFFQVANASPNSAVPDTQLNPYGANTFLSKEVEDWKKDRTMQMIQQAGIGWIKQEFEWDQIEFKKGYFRDDKFNKSSWQKYDQIVDLAAKYNVKVVARLDRAPDWARPANSNPGAPAKNYQDYADFVGEFVKHFKGKVSYIQIWNEPNLHDEWLDGTPVDPRKYTEMLKLAYKSAKQADPNIRVMSAPLAMNVEDFPDRRNLSELIYLDEMYKAGAKDFIDIMPANGYGLEFAPDAPPDPKVLNFRRVELLHNIMVKYGDTNKAVWFNEYGWNASPPDFPKDQLIWRRVSEQQQADYTVQGIKYARDNWPWAGVVFIWYFRQVGDIPKDRSDYYFQMVTPEFEPKPVYNAVKQNALAASGQKSNVSGTPESSNTGTQPLPTLPPLTASITTGTSPGASPAATIFPTAPGNSPASATGTAAALPSPTTQAVKAVTTAAPVTGNASSDSSGGTPIPVIVGGLLILAAAGGLGFYFVRKNRPRA